MKLVLDTNILFSALIAGGKTRKLIITGNHDLHAPEYTFTELENHQDEIEKKTKLDKSDLQLLLNIILEQINITPKPEFENQLPKAEKTMGEVDPDDVPFLALALHLKADIWSDDKHFQKQGKVNVWKTPELIKHLNIK
ncbi:hypothetical protein AKJ37_02180 [candidate division MSBL1 archaeon SCGC-AAA259I09]|uniref:PIN domain-containing protein n=2 Tax=candidate division MSBL1 TaxID=215777 RepID=A0A133UUG3_9EURY|nr:hypothetical protein AKJ62_02030 [candidate division MSBL1 archaeon SCGC-AAA259D14]KXA97854.1 hypothetical protein AKJ37_02180 [candidate division MSBL1 archaeon SCGC-AAA259I09]